MSDKIVAAEGAILKGANAVSAAQGDIKSIISEVAGYVESVGGGWAGGGSTAFRNLMARWNEDTIKVNDALLEFESNLRRSQQTYDSTDEEQGGWFGQMASRLGQVAHQ